jgi:hypothetical protein
VSNISSPRLSTALDMAREEAWVWGMAGVKDLAQISGQSAPGEVEVASFFSRSWWSSSVKGARLMFILGVSCISIFLY